MIVELGQIGKILTGKTPKTSDKLNYETRDISFVKPSDILEEHISFIDDTESYISEKAKEKTQIVPANSVLVTCIGTIGKVGINKKECAFNQQINAIIPNTNICLSKYLAYLILHKAYFLKKIANVAVVPIINRTDFSKFKVNLVSIDEQKVIIENLEKLDVIILKKKNQINLLNLCVKSRFKYCCGFYF